MRCRKLLLSSKSFFLAAAMATGCSAGGHPGFTSLDCGGPTCATTGIGPVGGGNGSEAADGGVSSPSGGSTPPETNGTLARNCTTDPTFGVALCLSLPECPEINLDPAAFPSCGFQTTSAAFSVQCICSGAELCPIGAVATCADLPGLLQQASVTDLCNQAIAAGACRTLSGTSGDSAGSNLATCDRNCSATCNGAPACLVQCGC